MTLNLSELEQLAKAATTGEWTTRTEIGHPGVVAVAREGAFDWICSMQVSNSPKFRDNAAFIAAANPTTVLALIARVRELEAGLEEACGIADRDRLALLDRDPHIDELRALAKGER